MGLSERVEGGGDVAGHGGEGGSVVALVVFISNQYRFESFLTCSLRWDCEMQCIARMTSDWRCLTE